MTSLDVLDFSKLTWNVDAEGATTRVFSASDIASAVVTSRRAFDHSKCCGAHVFAKP